MLPCRWFWITVCVGFLGLAGGLAGGQEQPPKEKDPVVPDLAELVARPRSEVRVVVQRFEADRGNLDWEMVLYDRGFPQSAEDRVGFLFWRMHRCARIHFSLGFHLGKMTPRQCVDYLVQRVGHEPDNAAAEVRRSFQGNYGPLYQAAYLLGGLQIRALRKEMVDPGKMSERQFHDSVLQGGNIPIAMVRPLVRGQKLERDGPAGWKFYAPDVP